MPTGSHLKVMQSGSRICQRCRVEYTPRQRDQKFCTRDCKRAWHHERARDLRQMLEGLAGTLLESGIDLKRVAQHYLRNRPG